MAWRGPSGLSSKARCVVCVLKYAKAQEQYFAASPIVEGSKPAQPRCRSSQVSLVPGRCMAPVVSSPPRLLPDYGWVEDQWSLVPASELDQFANHHSPARWIHSDP